MTLTRTIAVWALQVAVGALFLLSGWSKLAGSAMAVGLFDAIGIGQWFRYLTGALEVTGGMLLFVPPLALFGAAVLAAVMVGAVFTHVFVVGGSPLLPTALLAAASTILWLRRHEVGSLLNRRTAASTASRTTSTKRLLDKVA